MNNKSIDINQRIPLDTLYAGLEAYLNDDYSNEYIIEQLKLEFQGENRLKKALRIVNKIIIKSPIRTFLDDNKANLKLVIKKKIDRNIVLIALLNAAFPFSFDVLKVFGKYFSVQEIINAETIKKSISSVYGGNRATENGIYSVVPMFIEAGFFSRHKQGIYEFKESLPISNKLTYEIYVESFKLNNKTENLQDYELLDPYFNFIVDVE
tara:strand:+ start:1176 stop:1802 length:627 start_codon:yes stop_codon:yes gene_type:complete